MEPEEDSRAARGLRTRTILALFAATGLGQGTVGDELRASQALEAGAACDRIESLLERDLREAERRACIEALLARLPDAPAPLTDAESERVAAIQRDHPAGEELLVGRYALTLCTPRFAARARENRLLVHLDLAYVLLRELFHVDPVRIKGHRYVIFPERGKPGGHSASTDLLTLTIGESAQDDADCLETFFHELAHPFINLQPGLHHWRSGGLGEGWAELCQAYVPERLAFLGSPFAGRFESYVQAFRDVGRSEYLSTRLPIEEIVAYGPSSSFLMELALRDPNARADWTPFQRLFAELAASPQPVLPWRHWPAQVAADALRAFDPERVRALLREYRFPPEREIRRTREALARGPFPPLDCAERRQSWADAGFTVVTDWQVLGPFPDPEGRRLGLDPIDEWNYVESDEHEVGGETFRWRTDPPIDACGTVQLGALSGGEAASVFYLRTRLAALEEGPVLFELSTDDDGSCWLDGERFHAFWGNRGVDVDQIDTGLAFLHAGGGELLVKIANHGGPAGLHLRYRPAPDFAEPYRLELAAADPARRGAAVSYLGSRRWPREIVAPLLVEALEDRAPAVRAAAARALAGIRNDADVVEALVGRWSREREAGVASALARGLFELSFEELESASDARRWWKESRAEFRERWFVECERAYGVDPIAGGFFGNQETAFGNQCVDRGFGCSASDFFALPLFAPSAGPRRLELRYALGRDEPCLLHLRVLRGTQQVFERRDLAVPRTRDWSDFAWLRIPLGELERGGYRIELRTNGIGLDCDTLGWRKAE